MPPSKHNHTQTEAHQHNEILQETAFKRNGIGDLNEREALNEEQDLKAETYWRIKIYWRKVLEKESLDIESMLTADLKTEW